MKTIPTDGMLQAMLTARVGDEQKGEDPTTNELCARVADLTGLSVEDVAQQTTANAVKLFGLESHLE